MNIILKELENKLPKDGKISEVKFEGSEIVIYTKSKQFFRNSESHVKEIVRRLKKRVEVRPDISITIDPEETKKIIERIVPEGAGIKAIYFEPELGKVVIESQKPGMVIGKGGETYRKIKEETLWLPKIERAPAIESDIVRAVRNLLHTEIDYRKKFLNKIGQRINEPIELTDEQLKNEWVRLTFMGGSREVGRSSILVSTPHSNVLLDCGVDIGAGKLPEINIPEFNLDNIDAIALSHSHLDHCGYIPYLYEKGYSGPLYCTPPTRDLMVLLCLDYIDVCQKSGRPVAYTKKSVEKAVKHSVVLDYGEVSDIAPNMRLTLQPSSHILGSSLIHLHIGEGLHNILYTGDMKFVSTRLFDRAFTGFQRIETVLIEATYGGAENILPSPIETEKRFLEIIHRTMKNGGKVLVPAFAIGRAQEIMAILASSRFEYPIYMEGMLSDATAIHTAYPEYLSRHLQREIFHHGRNPFISEIFHTVVPKERDSIIDSSEPAVIIATSGMLIGGPSVEYLKALSPDKRNMLLFIGYQAEGTLGRRIQKGWKEIPISTGDGKTKTLQIKMEIETARGFSGHADRRQLMNYIYKLRSRPERVIVNHGEPKRCVELARDIHKTFKCETFSPKVLETLRLR